MSIFKRILTALLAVSLLLVPFHVQALGAAQAGQLVLTAVTQDGARFLRGGRLHPCGACPLGTPI